MQENFGDQYKKNIKEDPLDHTIINNTEKPLSRFNWTKKKKKKLK